MYFEKESINTLDVKGEVLITIMASVAQQESEPISRDKKQALLIANATNEEKRRRLADIKAFLKGHHIKLEEYDESLVNRLVDEVRVKEDSFEVKLQTGEIITIEK